LAQLRTSGRAYRRVGTCGAGAQPYRADTPTHPYADSERGTGQISKSIALGDLILTEVLQGFRKDTDFRKAQAFLAELPFYELGGYEVCLQAARNYRALRAKGMTVHKTIDMVIATACIEWNFELLHNDRDFDALQQILGLRVAVEG